MFEYDYDKKDSIPRGNNIRILSLAASETFTDPIHVSLSIASLKDQPTYEALSYCWGDASDKRLIFCDGRPFPVGQNLEEALRHLRQSEGARVLWIDAICINQNDFAERTSQVKLMRHIYQTASRVLVWLGGHSADSNLVFPLCERMMETWGDLYLDDSFDFEEPGLLYRSDMRQVLREKLREIKRRRALSEETEDEEDESVIGEESGVEGRGEGKDGEEQEAITDEEEAEESEEEEDEDEEKGGGEEQGTEVEEENAEEEETEEEEEEVQYPTKEEVTAALQLINRPWFTRCWVLQEVCLPREALVLCGMSSLSWDFFYPGIMLILVLGEGGLRGRPEKLQRRNLVLAMSLRGKLHYSGSSVEMQHIDLLWILWKVRDLDVTDPRDKVYSVLGLIDPEEAQMEGLDPDYTVSVEECYKRAALAIMSYTRNLDALLTDSDPGSQLNSPSWVPDWVYQKSPAPISFIRNEERANPENIRYKQFRASTSDQWDAAGNVDGDVLRLSGYVFDTIVALEDTLTVPQVDQVDISKMFSSMSAFAGYYNNVFGGMGAYLDALVRWEKLAFSSKYSRYPTGEDPETVFAMTLCAGNINGPEAALTGFREWRKLLRGPKAVSFLGRFNANNQIYKSIVAASGLISTIKGGVNRVYATATERTLYRRLSRTEKGYLAIVPSQSAIGDQILLFQGGKMPFVARSTPHENTGGYKLIGPSYVHGIMYGEAWDHALAQDIAIV
ncbi:heterokaryon incompatibility protein-domain-containing protein [Xylaria cubensis]|nr:heterokaryon incompatibility protein-domain-containing protein [Xylaria cubensis]